MKELLKRQNYSFVKSTNSNFKYSNNVSILFYSTVLYKLGPQKQFFKKWKKNNFWQKKNSKDLKIGYAVYVE